MAFGWVGADKSSTAERAVNFTGFCLLSSRISLIDAVPANEINRTYPLMAVGAGIIFKGCMIWKKTCWPSWLVFCLSFLP